MVENFLKSFFDSLNAKNVEYCVWGNHENLPYSLNGSDLDIVVLSKDKGVFLSVLFQVIEKFEGRLVSYFRGFHTQHFRFASIDWGIMIDVMYDNLYYNQIIYIPGRYIWSSQRKTFDIKVNDLDFSYLAGFLKELLHNGVVKQKYLDGVRSNVEPYHFFLREIYGEVFYDTLLRESKRESSIINLNELRKIAIKALRINSFAFLKHFSFRLSRLFNPSPGFSIVFLGVDGAGKSTIIQQISPILKEAFHNAVFYEHLRPNYLRSLASIFGKSETENNKNDEPHGKSTSGYFGSIIRWSYYLLDYTFGFLLKIWPRMIKRSCVWIFDRYYYDFIIDPKRMRINLPKLVTKIPLLFIPSPDIIICLGTTPEVIHNRKPELSIEETRRQVKELSGFCKSKKSAVWVDTGESIEKSVQKTMEEIIKMMSKRFEYVQHELIGHNH